MHNIDYLILKSAILALFRLTFKSDYDKFDLSFLGGKPMEDVPTFGVTVEDIHISFRIVAGFLKINVENGLDANSTGNCLTCKKEMDRGYAIFLRTSFNDFEQEIDCICNDCMGKYPGDDVAWIEKPELIQAIIKAYVAKLRLYADAIENFDLANIKIENYYYREPRQE